MQCFTPQGIRSTLYLNRFAENQLFPSLIGLSPLATSHPELLQQLWVRSSSKCYLTFNLLMARSLGFGSNATN